MKYQEYVFFAAIFAALIGFIILCRVWYVRTRLGKSYILFRSLVGNMLLQVGTGMAYMSYPFAPGLKINYLLLVIHMLINFIMVRIAIGPFKKYKLHVS